MVSFFGAFWLFTICWLTLAAAGGYLEMKNILSSNLFSSNLSLGPFSNPMVITRFTDNYFRSNMGNRYTCSITGSIASIC